MVLSRLPQNFYNPIRPILMHIVSGFEHCSRISAAHNRRDTQLTGDNSHMGERRTNIGDHSRCSFRE